MPPRPKDTNKVGHQSLAEVGTIQAESYNWCPIILSSGEAANILQDQNLYLTDEGSVYLSFYY